MYTFHTVKSGETLSGIARKYSTTVAEIMSMNKDTIENKNIIHVGQIIRVKYSDDTAPGVKGDKNYSAIGEAVEKCLSKIEALPEFKTLEGLLYADKD